MSRRRSRAAVVGLAAALVAVAGCGGGGGGSAPSSTTPAAAGPPAGPAALREEWSWAPPDGSSPGMPAADATGVAVTLGRSRTVLLDAEGRLRWEAQRVGVRDVSPLLTPDLVVVATDDGAVAYDRGSGRLRWEAVAGERVNTPVPAAGRAVASTWEGSLLAFDLDDGHVAWRAALGGDALGPPTADGDVVVATFDTGHSAGMVGVEAETGRSLWAAPLPPDGVSAPAVVASGGAASPVGVAVAGDVAAHAFSLDDGSPRWRVPLEGAGSPEVPPLALPEGAALVPHRQGGVALIEAGDGKVRWQVASDGAAVRGAPAGPGPEGWFVLPLDDGRLLLARSGSTHLLQPPDGLVAGVAAGPAGWLVIATAHGGDNRLTVASGW